MSSRNTWVFAVPTEKVLHAAKARQAYHEEQVREWLAKQEKAEAAMREADVELHGMYVDPRKSALQFAVRDANTQASYHAGNWKDFARWVRVLENTSPRIYDVGCYLSLDRDDLYYFGLLEEPGLDDLRHGDDDGNDGDDEDQQAQG